MLRKQERALLSGLSGHVAVRSNARGVLAAGVWMFSWTEKTDKSVSKMIVLLPGGHPAE